MYVSFDGGQRWMLWRGLPRVPVRSILVHPRDKDLVIGTHGRGAWILDDVRPLEALAADPNLTKQALHLFPVPPAVQYREGQVPGPRFTGSAMFLGANRPYGTLLTYSVGGRRGSSGSSGSGDTDSAASPASSATPAPDTMATIQVLSGDSIIRTFKGPAHDGLNRTAWPLVRDGFREPRNPEEEQQQPPSPEGVLPPGPDVLPGAYVVRVIFHGDTAAGRADVRPDPRITVSEADRRANLAMIMRAGQRQDVATEAVNRLREAKQAVDDVNKRLAAKDDSASKALRAAGDSLKHKLTTVEELFMGKEDIQGFIDSPNAVLPQIGNVIYSVGSSWEAPTAAETAYLQQAEQLLQAALARFNAVISDDVAAYRRQVDAAHLSVMPALEPLTMDWQGGR
jgi:hypothetical protein